MHQILNDYNNYKCYISNKILTFTSVHSFFFPYIITIHQNTIIWKFGSYEMLIDKKDSNRIFELIIFLTLFKGPNRHRLYK